MDIGGVMENYDKIFEVVDSKKAYSKPSGNDIQEALGRVVVVSDATHSVGAAYDGNKTIGSGFQQLLISWS